MVLLDETEGPAQSPVEPAMTPLWINVTSLLSGRKRSRELAMDDHVNEGRKTTTTDG